MTDQGNLAPLFRGPAQGMAQPMGYLQGTIITFNRLTGQNTVQVGNAVMTNLPMYNSTEALLMVPGTVVGLMVVGNTVAILGRLVIPNTPDAGSALSAIGIKSSNNGNTDNTASGPYVDLGGPYLTDVFVGPSRRLLILLTSEIQAPDPAGSSVSVSGGLMGVSITGATTISPDFAHSLQLFLSYNAGVGTFTVTLEPRLTFTRALLLTGDDGLNPGLHSITALYCSANAGQTVKFQNRNLTAIAL